MQEIVYHTNFELEDSYWWFVARNKIIKKVISDFVSLDKSDYLLDVGCGTGSFAAEMNKTTNVIALDTSELALEYTRKRGLSITFNCFLKDFPKQDYKPKLITFLDVIEHIENDSQVLNEAYQILSVGDYIIATVPAYQWLWGKHDEIHMHFRRYTVPKFKKLFNDAGFKVVYSSYFNTLLFPLAVIKRFVDKLIGADKHHTAPIDPVSPTMNKILQSIFSFEKNLIPSIFLPFGLSIILVAKK